jgi:Uma2 family endonuclease
MATATAISPELQTDERFVLRGVDWKVYDGIRRALENHPTRLSFDGRNIELVSPSPIHESYGRMFGCLLSALALELDIEVRGGRSTTFRRQDVPRGLEPDDCYWIQNERAVRGKAEIDLSVDPPPDLAIEIEISRSAVDRLEIYSKLGVPEIWCFNGEFLRILRLQPEGAYHEADRSACFPFLDLLGLVPFLGLDPEIGETSRVRQFVEWLRRCFPHGRP